MLKGRSPDGPIPLWAIEATENHALAQAAPGWDPTAELGDFQLKAMVAVHQIYEQVRAEEANRGNS